MKKIYVYLFFMAISFGSISQYDLSQTELTNGYAYLKNNAGFKNPSSVKLNDIKVSTFKFVKECFTWARYDISAQNGFGGYVRSEFYVWFFEGKPFWTQESGGDYPATPYYANSDEAADYLIGLATKDYLGEPLLKSKYCPGEEEKIKAAELQKEIEIKQQEEERIKLQNQKKDADKLTIQKINDLVSKDALEDATKEYSKLNFENSEIKSIIQKKLDVKFGSEEIILMEQNFNEYIYNNSISLIELEPKIFNLKFDKKGRCSDYNFPNLDNIPVEKFGNFFVYKNSKAEIKIELKDSILVSSTYSTSNTKPLFVDKNDNLFFKTKTGLPTATIINNPEIDKKLVRINKTYKREKYANGILIDSQEFKTEKTVGIMKKDQ